MPLTSGGFIPIINGGGDISPRSMSGLAFWYDFSRVTGSDGSAIASLSDLSSSGLDLTQGTGSAQPTLKLAIRNGLNVARFDGGDTLTRASVNFSATNKMTIFAVGAASSLAAARAYASFGLIGTNAGSWELRARITTGEFDTLTTGNTGNSQWGAPAVGTAWHTLSSVIDFSLAAGEAQGWTDGVNTGSQVSDSNNTGSFANSLTLSVGQRSGGVSFFVGDIGEVFGFTRALNATERTQLENYCRRKWATP